MDECIILPTAHRSLNRARQKRFRGLKPDKIEYLKISCAENISLQIRITTKYNLRPEGFQTLALIWINPMISTFKLWEQQRSSHRAIQIRLERLLKKGLIEISGRGKHFCPLYCVSPLFLSEVAAYSLLSLNTCIGG